MAKGTYRKHLDANVVLNMASAKRLFERYAEREGYVLVDVEDHVASSNKWVGLFDQAVEPIIDHGQLKDSFAKV